MHEKEITALFIGNRDCIEVKAENIERAVIKAIEDGIRIFLNGGQGYFDRTSAYAVHRLQERYSYIKSCLVLPYRTFNSYDAELYDEIIFPFEKHIESYYTYMGNIEKRNRYLVDHSGTAICYVRNHKGGAGKTLAYAKRKKLKIIDLTSGEEDG